MRQGLLPFTRHFVLLIFMDYHGLHNTSIIKMRLKPVFGAEGTFVPIASSPVSAMAAASEKLWELRGCPCCGRGTGKGAEAFPWLQLRHHASTLPFGLQGKEGP